MTEDGMFKDEWRPGDRAAFEYHCNRAHDSEHAEWWYRSHQPVTVIGPSDGEDEPAFPTLMERGEAGHPITYKARWDDGFEGDVFEDELLTSADFYEPDLGPPPQAEIDKARRERAS